MVSGRGKAYNRVYGNRNSETVKVNIPKNSSKNSQPQVQEKVQRFKPAASVRGLVWKMKRWFYATLRKLEDELGEEFDATTSREVWRQLASSIVEYNQEHDLSDNPARGELEWDVIEYEGKLILVIKRVKIWYFEITQEKEFEVSIE